MNGQKLESGGGRRLTYMRLSVTDLCNMRCRYCMPPEGVQKLRHEDILSFEEMLRLARIGASLGLRKLRLTGGEPLVRKGLIDFIRSLSAENLFQALRMTTNGVLLAPQAEDLKAAGLSGLNISLDALDPKVFAEMAGLPGPEGERLAARGWEGFRAAVAYGFDTKINCVPIRGVNESQLVDMAGLVYQYPVDVRFIEHMPIGSNGLWNKERFMSSAELLERFERELGPLELIPDQDPSAPARRYSLKGALGAVGFISAVSGHFCRDCNRIRLTADGKLKPCLLTEKEIDIKTPLRAGAGDEELKNIFIAAAGFKPSDYGLAASEGLNGGEGREMVGIGG